MTSIVTKFVELDNVLFVRHRMRSSDYLLDIEQSKSDRMDLDDRLVNSPLVIDTIGN